jgi:DNA-directed RNA polymerase subunit F
MIQEIELIQSSYHPEEALEVLGNLIQQKIAYHSQKTLRHQELFGTSDAQAEQRLSELQVIKKNLIQELKAIDPTTLLHINGHVSISIVTQQQAS